MPQGGLLSLRFTSHLFTVMVQKEFRIFEKKIVKISSFSKLTLYTECINGGLIIILLFLCENSFKFVHADEASEAIWHKDKRIINWQPFLHSVYFVDGQKQRRFTWILSPVHHLMVESGISRGPGKTELSCLNCACSCGGSRLSFTDSVPSIDWDTEREVQIAKLSNQGNKRSNYAKLFVY